MIQHLPPRQRAVLILREALHWQASEVAELLGTSVAAVDSAPPACRTTIRTRMTSASDASRIDGAEGAELLTRYVDAFERYDMDALVSVLHEEATSNSSRECPPNVRPSLEAVRLAKTTARRRSRCSSS
jgi:RNA polymerase sigma-70 factor, ECF subfamily